MIKDKYPNASSLKEFLTSEDYLWNSMLKITQTGDILTCKDIFTASKKTMEKIPSYVVNIKQKFVDNTIITPRMLKNVLHDKKISLTTIQENGIHGDSQNDYINKDYRLNLTDEP